MKYETLLMRRRGRDSIGLPLKVTIYKDRMQVMVREKSKSCKKRVRQLVDPNKHNNQFGRRFMLAIPGHM